MADKQPPRTTAKIAVDLIRKAKIVCAHGADDMNVQEYLDKLLRSSIERDYERTMKRIRESNPKE